MKIQLSFIILVWNSRPYLHGCFDSIVHKCGDYKIPFEILVVDNGSSDGSLEVIEEYQGRYGSDTIRLISLPFNHGTTRSRNLAIRQALGSYLCVLDSDTELGEGNLATLLERLDQDQGIGIIAPRLLLPDGTVQNSVKRFPTMLDKLLKIPKILFGIEVANSDYYGNFPFARERKVETAISACWFFRRDVLDRVGHLDENIFYSPEDLDYSVRVWKNGLSILYYPEFSVHHYTQQISHKNPFSKVSLSHFRGLVYYYKKHGGWIRRPSFNVR